MNIRIAGSLLATASVCLLPEAQAEIVSATPDHYTLRHEATSPQSPEVIWERLIHPETWWSPDHTYSGDARNLSMQNSAGGHWREDWDGSSVLHGTVQTILDGEMLRLDAPFGPLQGMGVQVTWTITLEAAEDGGTKIVFDEVANGSSESGLDQIAPAVDYVKLEAMRRLAAEPVPIIERD